MSQMNRQKIALTQATLQVTDDITQAAEISHSRIQQLLAKLEGTNTDAQKEELLAMKDSMDFLMGVYFEQHLDLDSEMNGLLDNLRRGLATQEELESMLKADQSRSGFVLKMAGSLKIQLENVFELFGSVLDSVYKGGAFPIDAVNHLYSDMNIVMDSVDFISKVVSTPAKTLSSTLDQVENDLRTQVEIVLSRSHSYNSLNNHVGLRLTKAFEPSQEIKKEIQLLEIKNNELMTPKPNPLALLDSYLGINQPLSPAEKSFRQKGQLKAAKLAALAAASNAIVIPSPKDLPRDVTPTKIKEIKIIKIDGSTQTDSIEDSLPEAIIETVPINT